MPERLLRANELTPGNIFMHLSCVAQHHFIEKISRLSGFQRFRGAGRFFSQPCSRRRCVRNLKKLLVMTFR